MKTERWEDVKRRKLSPERLEHVRQRVEQETLEMNLKALRDHLGVTQEELAAKIGMSQAELSRSERREDHLLSTLRRYVEALGGRLDVRAVFGDKQIELRGV